MGLVDISATRRKADGRRNSGDIGSTDAGPKSAEMEEREFSTPLVEWVDNRRGRGAPTRNATSVGHVSHPVIKHATHG